MYCIALIKCNGDVKENPEDYVGESNWIGIIIMASKRQ